MGTRQWGRHGLLHDSSNGIKLFTRKERAGAVLVIGESSCLTLSRPLYHLLRRMWQRGKGQGRPPSPWEGVDVLSPGHRLHTAALQLLGKRPERGALSPTLALKPENFQHCSSSIIEEQGSW